MTRRKTDNALLVQIKNVVPTDFGEAHQPSGTEPVDVVGIFSVESGDKLKLVQFYRDLSCRRLYPDCSGLAPGMHYDLKEDLVRALGQGDEMALGPDNELSLDISAVTDFLLTDNRSGFKTKYTDVRFAFSKLTEVIGSGDISKDTEFGRYHSTMGGSRAVVYYQGRAFTCRIDDPAQEWREIKLPHLLSRDTITRVQIQSAKDLGTGKWWIYFEQSPDLFRIAEDNL